MNDVLYKSWNYLLSLSTRMVCWLTSLISIERLDTTLSWRGRLLKQPQIACRLILFILFTVFISDLDELFFYKSFSTKINGERHGSMCVLDIASKDWFLWTTSHLLFLILQSRLFFLVNLFLAITISLIIIHKKKIKTSKKTDPSQFSSSLPGQAKESVWMNMRARLWLIIDVLRENKEFVLSPAITLVPQLFSLPLFISSFVFDCQNLDNG